jgi:hypothetical protein
MKLKTQMVAIALALGVSTSLTWSQDRQPRQLPNPMNTIVGVWGVTRHGVNCDTGGELSSFMALMTFHRDGTVSANNYGPFPENAFGGGEYGLWQHGPGNTFSFRDLSYAYDDSGQFAASVIITASGELTSANSLSYGATVEVYDPDGNLLFTACARATATRFD